MTTLTITPDIAKKRMKLAGRIAAGEKVAVTVKGFGSRPTATTRLRVLFAHNIIAQFPLPPAEGEQIVGWTVSGEDLTAVLNLNTVQAEKFARVHAVNCLFILDDVSDGVRQLYATEDMEILRWIKTPDTDVPVNLDDFPKMLEEVRAEINDFKTEMANRANEYETSLSSAWNTYRNSLNGSIQQFTSTVMSAVNNKADAQTVNSHVQRSDNPHNVTKSQVGLGNVDNTSDASKPVSNFQRQAIETAVSEVRQAVVSEANRAGGREREIANSVDAERRRASAEEEKLDLAIRTEKNERDGDVAALRALIAAVDGMKRVIADSLPDPGEEYADKIYMIPSSNPGERNVKDEFMCFYTSSEGWQWEQIGSTAIDIDAKQDKLYTQGEQSVWSFSTESTGSEIEAFMAAAGNYSVSESAVGGGWMYSVTGYDTSVYYVAIVVRTQKSTTVDFYVFDQTETELYGQIRATYAAVPTNIPAQVDTTPVHDSGRLVTSGGTWSAIWGTLSAIPHALTSVYHWAKSCFASPAAIAPKFDLGGTYAVGDIRIEVDVDGATGLLYRCKKGYTSSGQESNYPSADPEHWEEVDVNTLLAGKLGNTGTQTLSNGLLWVKNGGMDIGDYGPELPLRFTAINGVTRLSMVGGELWYGRVDQGDPDASWWWPGFGQIEKQLARISNIYTAIQQIAPAWVSGTSYAQNALVSHNGVVYRCKANTVSPHTATPDADTTHWEAKKVSELFLLLTGGTMTGTLTAQRFEAPNGANGGLRLHYADYNATIYYHGASGVYIGVKQGTSGTYYIHFQDKGGTLALLSDTMRFSTAVSYAVGDVVFYNGAFYRCTTAHTAGAWNASHFAEVIGGLSTGTPTAPTPTASDDSTKIATTAFVKTAVAGVTPNLDYVMRVDPETGGIYYTTPDTNA